MNDNRSNKFKSYIGLENIDLHDIHINDEIHAKLLPGEALICEALNVVMFGPMTEQMQGLFGVLSITNFKLSFIGGSKNNENGYQQNLLLSENEVCLSNIDVVYQINDRGNKRKLNPGQSSSGKVKVLQIVCKNMRVFTFSFKNSTVDSGKNVSNALMHHAFPKIHTLLFAYDYRGEYYSNRYLAKTRLFSHVRDWKKEMERTGTSQWRISAVNQTFTSIGLPRTVVVPTSVTDAQLSASSEHFQNRFFPVWVWSAINGAALVRMADIVPSVPNRTEENRMLESVRKSHPLKKQPDVIDLSEECPSPKEVQTSYIKLRELCIPETVRQFWVQDGKFLSHLEHSRWLLYVSQSLTTSTKAANQLQNGVTVVLQEGFGRDMCCVISSITQLLLDPYWRTINGFQSLIQKEWVALGHPFAQRLGHTMKPEQEQSQIFLLFLDCVWQLLQQYPQAFEFTETYLTSLWDSAHLSIFETFLFDCEHDRYHVLQGNQMLFSVWDWGEQYPDKEKELFINPLYNEDFTDTLKPACNISNLELWAQCYFRWIPLLEIPLGGKPQIDLLNRETRVEVQNLKNDLSSGVYNLFESLREDRCIDLNVNSFYPFSRSNNQVSALQGTLILNSNLLRDDGMLDSQSIMNAPD